MSFFKDDEDEDLTYWFAGPLNIDDTTELLVFKIENDGAGNAISATQVDEIEVWCRRVGTATYQDITVNPISLESLPLGELEFEMYVENIGPTIPNGYRRTPFNVIVGRSTAAGWSA